MPSSGGFRLLVLYRRSMSSGPTVLAAIAAADPHELERHIAPDARWLTVVVRNDGTTVHRIVHSHANVADMFAFCTNSIPDRYVPELAICLSDELDECCADLSIIDGVAGISVTTFPFDKEHVAFA